MVTSNETLFPIVDVQYLTTTYLPWKDTYKEAFYNDPKIVKLADEIYTAFDKSGFLYLKNHGFDKELIDNMYNISRKFFDVQAEIKNKFPRKPDFLDGGYLGYKTELLQIGHPSDIKEAFDYVTSSSYNEQIDDHVPTFHDINALFFQTGKELTFLLTRLFAITLDLEDKEFFTKQCKLAGEGSMNPSVSRMLWYPEIKKSDEVLKNQLRCGEHADYGTVSILFQDDTGGLQVVNRQGEYVDMLPIKDSIIVNIADMLERWSAGRFKSNRHRVVVPTNHGLERRSLAFFLHPDYDQDIYCLDGSDKYEKLNYREHFFRKSDRTYGYR